VYDIEPIPAARVQPMRRGAPSIHVLDDEPGTVHLGAFEDGRLHGVVSGFRITPQGQPTDEQLQVYGPFGDGDEALVRALAERGRLWADSARPGLVSVGDGRWESCSYGIRDIEVLRGTEAVRRRPGMYVGSTGNLGVLHLLFELVDNTVDEHLAGHATVLRISADGGVVGVEDDGRGIPPEAIERVFTELHAGSTADGHRWHTHHTPFGVGLAVLGALSSPVIVTVDRDRRYQQVFARGVTLTPVQDLGPAVGRGTSVRFVPDGGIFGPASLPSEHVLWRLADVAVLNPALRISFRGAEIPSHGGLLGFARHLAGEVRSELVAHGTIDGILVDVAVVWGTGPSESRGWVNQWRSTGSHLYGAGAALKDTDEEGRVMLVAVQLDGATFSGRTRSEVKIPAVREAVRRVVLSAR
jgi:hypothetical protein